jgi:phosphatidylcholine synthase
VGRAGRAALVTAWLVHAFTATGAVLAYLAVEATIAGDTRQAFLYLVVATLVDAVDGALARLARVKERTPQFNGARLDDIVDYLTFVFVPVFILRQDGLIPDGAGGLAVASAVLLASAYGFSREDAKTPDHFFTGFPSYWNIVALYMVAIRLSPPVNAAILCGLVALVFVPIGYIYPSRTARWQVATVVLGVLWAIAMVAIIWALPHAPRWLVQVSLLYPVYYFGLSFVLHFQRTPMPPRPKAAPSVER